MSRTIQDITEELVRAKFPAILAKYENRPLNFEFEFPKDMEDKPEIKLTLYVGGIRMKYTLRFPLTIQPPAMERLEKML